MNSNITQDYHPKIFYVGNAVNADNVVVERKPKLYPSALLPENDPILRVNILLSHFIDMNVREVDPSSIHDSALIHPGFAYRQHLDLILKYKYGNNTNPEFVEREIAQQAREGEAVEIIFEDNEEQPEFPSCKLNYVPMSWNYHGIDQVVLHVFKSELPELQERIKSVNNAVHL